jgi:UDP-N-acetylmuramoylalanine--D-glutamate ligase
LSDGALPRTITSADPQTFHGRRVTVMGLGKFGGGRGAVRYLIDRGARVTLTDLRSAEDLSGSLADLELAKLEKLVLGRHQFEDFTTADLVVVNPAVRPLGNPFLDAAHAAGVPLSSEMNLFWQACKGRKIVVTGSNGKSTTATLIHHCLRNAGVSSRLGGNIGISLLPEVDQISQNEWGVLELSSFQLASLDHLQPAPDLAVVTNFTPNHLDWHGSLNNYRMAKQTAMRWQKSSQFAVLNADDPDLRNWPGAARRIWFGHETHRDQSISITAAGLMLTSSQPQQQVAIPIQALPPGLQSRHGLANAAAALGVVVLGMGIPVEQVLPALRSYQPLPHRMQLVGEVQGRTFINDSKATTPEAAVAAIDAVTAPIILIAGGKDKGVDLSALAAAMAQQVKSVVLIGDLAQALQQDIQTVMQQSSRAAGLAPFAARLADSMEDAVRQAWELSSPGDVILLSPGCASHGEFAHYEERGQRFQECLRSLAQEIQRR